MSIESTASFDPAKLPEYKRPASPVLCEQKISNSRFLTYLEPVVSVEAFRERLAEIKAEHPDARHWCWAYLVGCPGKTTLLSMSDDGEPSGTAGKPMLQILNHSGLGDLFVVVVRYFGGTKLGTGGLVRAYSSSVQQALERVEPIEVVPQINVALQMGFEHESWVSQWLQKNNLQVFDRNYSHQVELLTQIPLKHLEYLRKELVERSQNQIQIREG